MDSLEVWCSRGSPVMQGNKPMVGKIIERALKSLSDNQVIINRDVWLKVCSALCAVHLRQATLIIDREV